MVEYDVDNGVLKSFKFIINANINLGIPTEYTIYYILSPIAVYLSMTTNNLVYTVYLIFCDLYQLYGQYLIMNKYQDLVPYDHHHLQNQIYCTY